MKQKKFRDVRRRKELYNKYGWIIWTLLATIICVTVVWFTVSNIVKWAQEEAIQEYEQQQKTEPEPLVINTEQSHYGFITAHTTEGIEQYYGYIKQNTANNLADIHIYTQVLPGEMSHDGWCEE